MGAVEDEVTILVPGDYYGVALLPFRFHTFSQKDQTVFIVSFVQKKALEVY